MKAWHYSCSGPCPNCGGFGTCVCPDTVPEEELEDWMEETLEDCREDFGDRG